MLKNGATPEQAHEWDEDHDREGVAGNVIEQDIEDALIADHERRHRG